MNWFEVGKLEEISNVGSRVVNTHEGSLAVFRNSDDELFALNDCCYHKGGLLFQGVIHDRSVTYPLPYTSGLQSWTPATPRLPIRAALDATPLAYWTAVFILNCLTEGEKLVELTAEV